MGGFVNQLIKNYGLTKSEYDQRIPPSYTVDQPTAQQNNNSHKTSGTVLPAKSDSGVNFCLQN